MMQLIEYMREYNDDDAEEEEQLNFYGLVCRELDILLMR